MLYNRYNAHTCQICILQHPYESMCIKIYLNVCIFTHLNSYHQPDIGIIKPCTILRINAEPCCCHGYVPNADAFLQMVAFFAQARTSRVLMAPLDMDE